MKPNESPSPVTEAPAEFILGYLEGDIANEPFATPLDYQTPSDEGGAS